MDPDPHPQPPPANDLAEALARLEWGVEPGSYSLVAVPRQPGLDGALLGTLGGHAQIVFEPEEITILAESTRLAPVLDRYPGAKVEGDLVWIRFDMPMAWELVGFLAHVCSRLSAAGVPLGALCAFDRDHLFLARRYLERARPVLDGLAQGLVR